jgi:hypothetical protein
MRSTRKTSSFRLLSILVPLLFILATAPTLAQSGTPFASPVPATSDGQLPPAWLEFGPHGQLLARVLVTDACPSLLLDGIDVGMQPRTASSDDFPIVACEATIPFGVESAEILVQPLPLPDGPPTRIAVIGDTGCRLNDWEMKF